MGVNVAYDIYGRTEPSTIYLAKPGKRLFCALNGIDTTSVELVKNTNNTYELNFTVNKYIKENVISNGYDEVEEFMELYCDGIWFKIVDPPEITNDGTQETKEIKSESYEIMLSQFVLNNFLINFGQEDSYEVMYKSTHKDYLLNKLKTSFINDYKKKHPEATEEEISKALDEYDAEDDLENNTFFQIKFCYSEDEIKQDPTLEDLSLLHLILKHSGADIAGWSVGYVDSASNDDFEKDPYPDNSTIPYSERNILPNYVSNYEVDETSVYSFLTQEVSRTCRCIFTFDAIHMKINAYRPEALGVDTGIFLSFRNIQNNVTTSRDDSLITQFYVKGLDDYDIALSNYTTNVITDLTNFETEPYMNAALVKKYRAFKEYRENHRLEYVKYSQCYNAVNEKLTELENRVPTDSAQTTWTDCDMDTLQSAYTSNSAILAGLEGLYVDKDMNFDINELKKHKEDWDLYQTTKNYTLPEIVSAMQYLMDNHQFTDDEKKDWKYQPYSTGTGNLLSNPNPIILDTSWEMLNPKYGNKFELLDVSSDTLPSGVTRMVHLIPKTILDNPDRGRFGLAQKKISIELGETYILSCYLLYDAPVSSNFRGEFQLQCGNVGGEFIDLDAVVDEKAASWQKVKAIIKTGSEEKIKTNLINVAFTTRLGAKICGMQLEKYEGEDDQVENFDPTFGYYIQPESVMRAYETDWKLYGIDELKVKINTYQNCIDELKKGGFGDGYTYIPDAGSKEEYGYQMHQNYCDYQDLKVQAEAALKQRQAEYDCINEGKLPEDDKFEFTVTDPYIIKIKVLDSSGNSVYDENGAIKYETIDIKKYGGLKGFSDKRSSLAKDVLLDNWGIEGYSNTETNSTPFTSEEKKIIQQLCRQSTYSNDNIILTSIDDTSTAVEKSLILLNDAKKELYIKSRPQYIYSDTIENIYALPEFKKYHKKLDVNDYIYMGLDDKNFVKLRVIKISYNPCDLDESMEISFSNMIECESGRNDYNKFWDNSSGKTSHDGGQVQGVSKTSDSSTYVITADIIKRFFSNPYFTSKISNTTTATTGSILDVNTETLINKILNASQDSFSEMTSQTGFVKALDQKYFTSEIIVSKLLAENAVNKLFDSNITGNGSITGITLNNVKIKKSVADTLVSDIIKSTSYQINSGNEIIAYSDSDGKQLLTVGLIKPSDLESILTYPIVEYSLLSNTTEADATSQLKLIGDDILLSGNVSIESINTITNISTSASDVISNCHSHKDLQDKIQTLETMVEELQKQIDELKGSSTTS